MNKNIFSLMISFILLCAVLAGCASKAAPSDTVLWMNTAYAVLTTANNGEITLIGGAKKSTANKAKVLSMLESSWEVTDRKSADEQLEWLITEGQRADYRKLVESLQSDGFFKISEAELEEGLQGIGDTEQAPQYRLVWKAYQQFGENAIDAWDYSRALQLLGFYYLADLYTEQEALDKSLEIAKILQGAFSSWEEMMDSYMFGYQYWQGDDISDKESASYARLQVYQTLKTGKNNPYTLDWNVKLTDTWSE